MDTPTSESLPSAVPELVNAVRDTAEDFDEETEERTFAHTPSKVSIHTAWSQGVRTLRCSKAFYGEVWQFTGESWAELYRFNNGLEFDVYSQKPSSTVWSRLQLPSTSLRALQQLRTAMRLPGALKLDSTLNGNTPADLFDALLEQAGNVLRAIGGGGASQSEARVLLQQRAVNLLDEKVDDSEDLDIRSACSEELSQPMVGTEAIDVSICPLTSYPLGKPPCVAIIRLSSPLHFRRGDLSGNNLCFAALILCSSERPDDTRFAREFSRALAISFMDEEFAVAARMTPQGSPERVLGSFDSFLAALTLVPTVYMEPPSASLKEKALQASEEESEIPQWESEVNKVRSGYLLSDSLADSIERRICKVKGLPPEKRGDVKLHRQRQMRDEHPPDLRRRYFVEVHERAGPDQRWVATRRLRQGLQVDITPGETMPSPPHLPRLSTAALDRMVELMTLDSIGLNREAETADNAIEVIMEQLDPAGLPSDVTEEVLKALMDCATTDREIPSPKPTPGVAKASEPQHVLAPCPGDESCHVMILASTTMPENHNVVSTFIRFQWPFEGVFASCESPVRFLMVLIGPAKARLELCRLKDALSALLLDEDLMGDLALADSKKEFRTSVRQHVGNLVFISHTQLQMGSASLPAEARDSEKTHAKSDGHGAPIKGKTQESLATTACSSAKTSVPASEGTHVEKKHSSLHKRFTWLVGKLQKYSVPLVTGVIGAMIWENVDSESYHKFTHTPFWSGASVFKHDFNLHFFVNDIFMCFFFGLAIKEVTEALLPGGSLHPLRRAANPLFATCGGIIGPVAVYILTIFILDKTGTFSETMCFVEDDSADRRLGGTASTSTAGKKQELCELSVMMKGWGVPTATDISLAWMFALLVFGAGHPCINFLLLLAIVDDALGMVIIAVFYPNPEFPVEPLWLLLELAAIGLAILFRWCQFYHWQLYVFVAGPLSWIALLKAHVHPALALCVVVPFMPAKAARLRRKKTERHISVRWSFLKMSHSEVHDNATKIVNTMDDVTDEQRQRAVERATALLESVSHAPLHAFEHSMKLPVDIGMFFFGLANAGVQVDAVGGVTWAVVIALLVGKTFGIAGFGLFAVCIGFDLPNGISIGDLFAVSALGGIGLTVALFVANQAFTGENLKAEAKMGAVLSVGCAIVAFAIQCAFGSKEGPEDEDDLEEAQPDLASERSSVADVDAITDFQEGSEPNSEAWVDDLLVDDILQTLWTQRRYQMHGTSMPTPNRRASISGGRRGSISRRGSFSEGRRNSFGNLPGLKPGSRDAFARQISTGSAISVASLRSSSSGFPGLRGTASMEFGPRDSSNVIGERFCKSGEKRLSTKEVIGERFKSRPGRNSSPWTLRSPTNLAGRTASKESSGSSGNPPPVSDDVHLSSPRTLV